MSVVPQPPAGAGFFPGAALLRGDLGGAFTAAVVLLAIQGSYGMLALAPLGPGYAGHGFVIGLFATVLGNVAAVLAGARGPMLCGPSAAMALLVPPLLGTLLGLPGFMGADGRPDVPLLLAAVSAGVLLAGLGQVVFGALRLGTLVSYVPYPVHAGFMNAVAVLMLLAVLPYAMGLPAGAPASEWHQAPWGAPVVAVMALVLAQRPPRWLGRLPAFLVALVAATAVHHAIAVIFGAGAVGPQFALPSFASIGTMGLAELLDAQRLTYVVEAAPAILSFALAVFMMSTLQTLMAASAVDGLLQRRVDSEQLLRAQGAANMAVAVMGGLPTAGALSMTVVNLNAGGRGTASRMLFGLCLAALFLFAGAVMRHLPLAAIAGLFIAAAWSLVDGWSRHACLQMLRVATGRVRPDRSLLSAFAVMALVALSALGISLIAGVAVGILAAMVMFVRGNVRTPVRCVGSAATRSSRKIRPSGAIALLRSHGAAIGVLELDGALFFGTADAATRALEAVARHSSQVIVDFERVGEVDASGARVLLQSLSRVHDDGRRVLLAGLAGADRRMAMLRAMDSQRVLASCSVHPDLDRALEAAEDRLLDSLDPHVGVSASLTLEQTVFGEDLDADELEALRKAVEPVRATKGQVLFRRGDPGDALYVLLAGQVGIWLGDAAAGGRRLVSFAPGVPFGEIALLHGSPRSADAVVEADAVLARLDRRASESLALEQPVLHGKLMRAVALHLATRVRALTDELEVAARR